MNRIQLKLMLLAVLFPISSVLADEWPQWRGPHRDGVWSETGAEKWKALEDNASYSAPIVITQGGERIWEDLTAVPKARWSNIHFIKNGDKVWMFNERGELLINAFAGRAEYHQSRETDRTDARPVEPQRWCHVGASCICL